jgi:hypothetical protein
MFGNSHFKVWVLLKSEVVGSLALGRHLSALLFVCVGIMMKVRCVDKLGVGAHHFSQ